MVKNIPPTLDALRRHKKSTTTKQDCVKKSPYYVSLRIQSKCGRNANQNNSEYGHVLRSAGE